MRRHRLLPTPAIAPRYLSAGAALAWLLTGGACGSNANNNDVVAIVPQDGGFGAFGEGGVDCTSGPDFTGCPCQQGQTKVCYTGPAGTEGVGACRAGNQMCFAASESPAGFGSCTGETVPSASNGGCIASHDGGHDGGNPGDPDGGTRAVDSGDSTTPDAGPVTRMVMFGGYNNYANDSYMDETWLFDGTTWTQVPGPGPSAKGAVAMAALDGKIILLHENPTETWSFDGSSWTMITASGPPPTTNDAGFTVTRGVAVMAPVAGKLMTFGGTDDFNNQYADTWLFDGAHWQQFVGPGPSARSNTIGGAVPGGKVLLFAGWDNQPGYTINDEWLFDGSSYVMVGSTGPSLRTDSVVAALSDRLLITGGYFGQPPSPFYDTWAFDGSAWQQRATTNASPPANNFPQQMFFGADCAAAISGSKIAVVGNVYSQLNDTPPFHVNVGIFDGAAWTYPQVANPPPGNRVGCHAASL